MRRSETGLEADVVRNALDEAAGRGAGEVVLVAVDCFVG
jgi:hypothetical protein